MLQQQTMRAMWKPCHGCALTNTHNLYNKLYRKGQDFVAQDLLFSKLIYVFKGNREWLLHYTKHSYRKFLAIVLSSHGSIHSGSNLALNAYKHFYEYLHIILSASINECISTSNDICTQSQIIPKHKDYVPCGCRYHLPPNQTSSSYFMILSTILLQCCAEQTYHSTMWGTVPLAKTQ